MSTAIYQPADTFYLQFVWRLPDGDYIRALYLAEVEMIIKEAEKYIVRLQELVSGSQESAAGEGRAKEAFAKNYWARVVSYRGNRVSIAWEAADGRPLYMRLATLTGEHDFFSRFSNTKSDSPI